MSFIVLFPSFIAAYVIFYYSLHLAFLNIFIPVVLFLPMYYQWTIIGVPDLNFVGATAIPLIFVFLIRGMPGWRFSGTDFLVFTFVFVIAFSEYINSTYKEAQNLIAQMILAVMFPYVLAKSLIEPRGLRVEFVKRIVLTLFVVSFFLVHECLTHASHSIIQHILGGHFFPGQGWRLGTLDRWGLSRAKGPFVHSIQAGIIMMIGFLLQQWLEWNKAWSSSRWLGFPKGKVISFMLLLGILAPISRAPWLGGLLALATIFSLSILFTLARRPQSRYLLIGGVVGSIMVIGILTQGAFKQFASVSREEAAQTSHERQTIAYRFDLYNTYGSVIMEKWMWGWGQSGWSQHQQAGQRSIDNAFLLLALSHGLVSVLSLIIIFIYLMLRLFIHAVSFVPSTDPKNSISLMLLALLLHEIFCLATVSLNTNNMTLLFMFFGWSDAYLHARQPYSPSPISRNHSPKLAFDFYRTI